MLAQFGFLFGGRTSDGRQNPFGPIGAILLVILAPIAAAIVQMAISRSREYEADRVGAEITGDPRGLASALARLEQGRHGFVNHTAEAHPASAHLFIVNPLSGQRMDNLFSTHPNTANRIAALEEMAARMPPAPLVRPQQGPWGAPPGARGRNPWG
jgi:heat shock protein HtpX